MGYFVLDVAIRCKGGTCIIDFRGIRLIYTKVLPQDAYSSFSTSHWYFQGVMFILCRFHGSRRDLYQLQSSPSLISQRNLLIQRIQFSHFFPDFYLNFNF